MKNNRLVIFAMACNIVFMLFALYGKNYVEYAPTIGWIGAIIISTTISIIFLIKKNRRLGLDKKTGIYFLILMIFFTIVGVITMLIRGVFDWSWFTMSVIFVPAFVVSMFVSVSMKKGSK
ncbi:hypothetical protein [Paenibacillus sp. P36]|uniref:hypothetical protein n=1 Tax=Paenibacillus sp. P36 TaxID=3342538 RepID=UPI0038B26F15